MTAEQILAVVAALLRAGLSTDDAMAEARAIAAMDSAEHHAAPRSANAEKCRRYRERKRAEGVGDRVATVSPTVSPTVSIGVEMVSAGPSLAYTRPEHGKPSRELPLLGLLNSEVVKQETNILPLAAPDVSPPKPKAARRKASYGEDFEAFWSGYPTTPTMSKAEAAKVWAKLDEADRKAAAAGLGGYRRYLVDNSWQSAVHAERYLRQRRFEGFVVAGSTVAGAAELAPSDPLYQPMRTRHHLEFGTPLPNGAPITIPAAWVAEAKARMAG